MFAYYSVYLNDIVTCARLPPLAVQLVEVSIVFRNVIELDVSLMLAYAAPSAVPLSTGNPTEP